MALGAPLNFDFLPAIVQGDRRLDRIRLLHAGGKPCVRGASSEVETRAAGIAPLRPKSCQQKHTELVRDRYRSSNSRRSSVASSSAAAFAVPPRAAGPRR